MATLPEPVRAVLRGIEPSESALPVWVKPRLSRSMLEQIAAADYGMDYDAHLAALRDLWRTGRPAVPMEWEPREVLELMRWSEPDDPDWKPGDTGTRGHLMRLFCCTALLQAAVNPLDGRGSGGENNTMIQLVDSAIELGDEASAAALRFLAWAALTEVKLHEEWPFLALAILVMFAFVHGNRLTNTSAEVLALWVIHTERAVRENRLWAKPPHHHQWMLGLTFHDMKTVKWRAIVTRELALAQQRLGIDATSLLRQIMNDMQQ